MPNEVFTIVQPEAVDTIKPTGARFEVESFLAGINLGELERSRAELALESFNLALEELNYGGDRLPFIVFSPNLTVGGIPRCGGFMPRYSDKGPTVFIDIGDTVALKSYKSTTIEGINSIGLSVEQANRIAVADTMFEEAAHYFDYSEGRISANIDHRGAAAGFIGDYYDQEHEARALEVANKLLVMQKHRIAPDVPNDVYRRFLDIRVGGAKSHEIRIEDTRRGIQDTMRRLSERTEQLKAQRETADKAYGGSVTNLA